jgi:hypothetical protein
VKRSATGITNAHSILLAALLFLACTHTDSWVTPPISTMPPFSTGSDVQITFNVDQDYWPTWNGDGKGILYAYVDRERVNHRCLGMLAPAGGTRLWQLCDNRAVRDDSMNSYAAFAMDTAGHLLVAEAVSNTHTDLFALPFTTLWLADTAHPYVRTTLLALPITVGTTPLTWLADLAWTGPSTFIVLGQQVNTVPHCVKAPLPPPDLPIVATQCNSRDTLWVDAGGVVLRGVIAAGHATLQAIAGTEGATSYSLAENGASINFTLKHQVLLFQVAATGGAPLPVPGTGPQSAGELMGVSCKGSTCVYARDEVTLDPHGSSFWFLGDFATPTGSMELHRVSLSSGADEIVQSNRTNVIFATPQISPVSGDVVAQLGGGWGHLETFATRALPILWDPDGNSVLHLYRGLVQ